MALLILVSAAPGAASFHEGEPVVLEITGDSGDAWAVAVRSHDQPTSYQGNELIVTVWAHPPYEGSVAAMGILELKPDANGTLVADRGGAGGVFRGEDKMLVEPVGEVDEPTSTSLLSPTPASAPGDVLGWMGERRFMEPGEWRYFVVWAAGSETSTFRLQGGGFSVEKLVLGEGHGLGNDELVNGGGVHVHQALTTPPGTSAGDKGYVGAGATAVSGTGATIEATAPLIGVFTEFHRYDACVGPCARAGSVLDSAVSEAQDGGFAKSSIETPAAGYASNPWDLYWLMPQATDDVYYTATEPGQYRFNVERLNEVSGPWYQDPLAGAGVRADGEQLVLSLGEVDYTQLEGLASP